METSSDNKKKAKHIYSREEAVGYLRRLADQLENGTIQISDGEVEFEGLVKVKESLKSKKGKTSIKVQFRLSTQEIPLEEAGEEAPPDASPEPALEVVSPEEGQAPEKTEEKIPSYKKLKKRMEKRFKEMGKALEEDREVSAAEVQAFYQDCLQMIAFSDADKGETLYPEFQAKARALLAAAENNDPAALNQAYLDLKAVKKTCHKQFK
ncbi:MAG: GAK system XXXCH domain-containing protein [Desulfarculaceae bacterium]|jgi:XXXCH domain-containing protein